MGEIADARTDQHCSTIQALHEAIQEDHQKREHQIHEAVHRESTERQHHQRELAQGVEQARSEILQTQQVIQNWADGHLQNYVTKAIQTAVGQVPQGITTDQVQQMITTSMQALLPKIQNMMVQVASQLLGQVQPLPNSPHGTNQGGDENLPPPNVGTSGDLPPL